MYYVVRNTHAYTYIKKNNNMKIETEQPAENDDNNKKRTVNFGKI